MRLMYAYSMMRGACPEDKKLSRRLKTTYATYIRSYKEHMHNRFFPYIYMIFQPETRVSNFKGGLVTLVPEYI